jgi:hypothetical protein
MPSRHTILCLTSYFKGSRFLTRAKQEGCQVILMTVESMLHEPWPREQIDEVFALKDTGDRRHVINAIAYLYRTRPIDRLVSLDDYDVELAAHLREHFRLPGMGDTTIRGFRDKLAMRYRARELGLAIPEFVPAFNLEDIRGFLRTVRPPWLIKPRSEASAIGIKKVASETEVFADLERRGDDQSFCLIEEMVPGDLYHVDSIVHQGQVRFAAVSRYFRPLLDVYHGGGVFRSQTLPDDHADAVQLRALNARLLEGFGMDSCASHSEFMKAHADGRFYFIETSARVGGANIAEMIEGARGLNLWEEWAKVEIDRDRTYEPPQLRNEHGGVMIALIKPEKPDDADFADPEIWFRLNKKHHVGLVLRSPSASRIEELLCKYEAKIQKDYLAVLPAATKATA